MSSGSRPVLSTYRIQLNRNFTFSQAIALVPYLAALGISHCYASPCLKARPGSTHGYDIVDHNSVNPEIGTAEEFDLLVSTLHRHAMGLILDIVPNHMGVMGSDNAWWLDVLENGEASLYSNVFDIDWEPIKNELHGKVLVAILADQYGAVLERGDLKLTFDSQKGEFSIFYFQHRFPIDPREYPRILQACAERLSRLFSDRSDILEFQSLVTSFGHLPERRDTLPERVAERHRDKEIHKRRLSELALRAPEIAECVAQRMQVINGIPGDASSFEELHRLIKAQAFRLAQWRVAVDDINYRRFFDINDLAAVRMQDPRVYADTHRLIFQWMADGKIDGVRIDHPDGLYNPAEYFDRLRRSFADMSQNSDSTSNHGGRYLVIEKILTGRERLRSAWPVDGTSGYEFADLVNGVFVEADSALRMEGAYRAFLGEKPHFPEIAYEARKLIIRSSLASELQVLANQLSRIALSRRNTCDFTLNGLADALSEVVACFPVYRTYLAGDRVSEEDAGYIELAILRAKHKSPAVDTSIFDFLREVLLTRIAQDQNPAYRDAVLTFAMKFQQFSSPVMAKGVEDTAFYRYHRLISLNEVGGDPQEFGTSVAEFHRANQERLANWPRTMLATTTHDTKRSEDARARIDALSEIPGLWRLRSRLWKSSNYANKKIVNGVPAPSLNEEYLLYQTLIGLWPMESPRTKQQWQTLSKRVEQYMLKAVREAKENTSWINQNTEYEAAVSWFVKGLLTPGSKNRFLADFVPFQRHVARLAMWTSLSQALLKLTVPGVPDIYQGSELWDFRLVDPDNRAPVDYDLRREFLRQLQISSTTSLDLVRTLLRTPEDGRMKLYLTRHALTLRRRHPQVFEHGEYLPLEARGTKAKHVVAFARRHAGTIVLVVATRFFQGLLGDQEKVPIGSDVWADTRIIMPSAFHPKQYLNTLTSRSLPAETSGGQTSLPVSKLLAHFPVALVVQRADQARVTSKGN